MFKYTDVIGDESLIKLLSEQNTKLEKSIIGKLPEALQGFLQAEGNNKLTQINNFIAKLDSQEGKYIDDIQGIRAQAVQLKSGYEYVIPILSILTNITIEILKSLVLDSQIGIDTLWAADKTTKNGIKIESTQEKIAL